MTHAAASTSSRLTVLLAAPGSSANEPWHQAVYHVLVPQGVQLLFAHTGREALELLESRRIHVAVLDNRLPQLSGLQVIKLAREHLAARCGAAGERTAGGAAGGAASFGGGGLPAAILLADAPTTPLLHEALGASVFTVLAKPVNHEQLLDALARVMRRFHNSQWPGGDAAGSGAADAAGGRPGGGMPGGGTSGGGTSGGGGAGGGRMS
ncbi:MAG: response regulator [Tepidisphaerales bacterium]